MIRGGGKKTSSPISLFNKEKEERNLWGCGAPIFPNVYCRNNQTIPYSSLEHLRPRKANNDHCSRNRRIRL